MVTQKVNFRKEGKRKKNQMVTDSIFKTISVINLQIERS